MPAGLTVYNTSGTVQVDENWRNYGFRQIIPVSITSYTTSPPNPAGYNGMPYALTVSGSAALLVACVAENLIPVKLHQYYNGSSWTFNWVFMCEFAGTTVTETVKFYVFDTMDGTYSNVGLEVFNASGIRTFHSDAPVMKLGGIQTCNNGFNGTSGHSYAPIILQNPLCGYLFGGGYRCFFYCLRTSGSTISSSFVGPGNFGATAPYTNYGQYAAIDVTGLS